MAIGYEVGAIFKIDDRATPLLERLSKLAGVLAEQFKTLGLVSADLTDTLASIGEAGALSAKSLSESFGFAASEIDGVRASVVSTTAAMERMAAVGKQVAAGGGAGGQFAAGAGLGWMMKPGPMIAGFAGYEALKGATNLADVGVRASISMGLGGVGGSQQIQDIIQKLAVSTGLSQGELGAATLSEIRGLDPLSPQDKMRALPGLLKFAAVENRLKGSSPEEAARSGVALAHQYGIYDVAGMEGMLNVFARMSMASPQSLQQLARASSYYAPLLHQGLGFNPTDLMALGIIGSQMGLQTKAGTGIANMFTEVFTADLTGRRAASRTEAMEKLGLISNGHITTHDPLQFLKTIGMSTAAMSQDDKMRAVEAAFGKQAARAVMEFSTPVALQNIAKFRQLYGQAKSPDELLSQLSAQDPKVKFQMAEQEFVVALTNLGTSVLPIATAAVQAFTDVLRVFTHPLKSLSETQPIHAIGAMLGMAASKAQDLAHAVVTFGDVHIHAQDGTDAGIKFLDEVHKKMSLALQHNQGMGSGTNFVPQTAGIGVNW